MQYSAIRIFLRNLTIFILFFLFLLFDTISIYYNKKDISILLSTTLLIVAGYIIVQNIFRKKSIIPAGKNGGKLPNRESLLKTLKECEQKRPKALILINIDSFEDINDFFGYDFGDKVLNVVSDWLKRNLPNDNAKLYKLEADNYAIFTEHFQTKDELIKYLKALSRKILEMNFVICDNELDIGFTMGAAINQENLLKLTHSAFKTSKMKKAQFEVYIEDKNSENIHEKNIRINKIIKKAIQNKKVIPFFQPIYDIKLHKIDKYESLMRIESSNNKYMTPSEFLSISKKSKLYPRLTKEMFSRVIDNIGSSKAEYSVNLSVNDILDKDTSYFILNKLEKNDIGSWLVFEILESEGIKNYKEVTTFLRDLKALGAKLAIDDFGSGYSNFEYILKLDVDFLKVDGSLIRNIDINEDTQIITSTIVNFAKKLQIKTIAEYVHNKDIYEKIKLLGFDYAQGYYIGEPKKYLCTSKNLDYLKEHDIFDFTS